MPLVPGARPSWASAARNVTSALSRSSAGLGLATADVTGVSESRLVGPGRPGDRRDHENERRHERTLAVRA